MVHLHLHLNPISGEHGPLEPPVSVDPIAHWHERQPREVFTSSLDGGAAAGLGRGSSAEPDPHVLLHVDLMGDCARRGRDARELILEADAAVADALASTSEVFTTALRLVSSAEADRLGSMARSSRRPSPSPSPTPSPTPSPSRRHRRHGALGEL